MLVSRCASASARSEDSRRFSARSATDRSLRAAATSSAVTVAMSANVCARASADGTEPPANGPWPRAVSQIPAAATTNPPTPAPSCPYRSAIRTRIGNGRYAIGLSCANSNALMAASADTDSRHSASRQAGGGRLTASATTSRQPAMMIPQPSPPSHQMRQPASTRSAGRTPPSRRLAAAMVAPTSGASAPANAASPITSRTRARRGSKSNSRSNATASAAVIVTASGTPTTTATGIPFVAHHRTPASAIAGSIAYPHSTTATRAIAVGAQRPVSAGCQNASGTPISAVAKYAPSTTTLANASRERDVGACTPEVTWQASTSSPVSLIGHSSRLPGATAITPRFDQALSAYGAGFSCG